jgi:hypothetical protein
MNSATSVATNACDYVITITSINGATVARNTPSTDTRNYVVAIASIERTEVVVNAASAPNASKYVVTIVGIERTGVENAGCSIRSAFASADGTRYYVVTISSIERAGVENAVGWASGTDYVFSTSDSIITSKSISYASIKYFLYPRRGDNIILLSKR